MRCDLHVHSSRSGRTDVPLLSRFVDESYCEPRAVYEAARRRGMELFTLTDHDRIDGALELAGLPETFVSEEVSCVLPGGRRLHVGVFDLDERQHAAVQARREDAESLFAYLAEQRLPACVNHPFSALTGRRATEDLQLAFRRLDLVEVRNGMLGGPVNRPAEHAARRVRLGTVAGSDAHTLASVARAYTVVPGAESKQEFLAALRRGLTFPAGRSGSYAKLTADLARIACGLYVHHARALRGGRAEPRGLALALGVSPLLPLLPLVSAALYLHEHAFARRHERLFLASARPRRRGRARSGPFGPSPAPAGALDVALSLAG